MPDKPFPQKSYTAEEWFNFAGNLAFELNNTLTAVIGYADLAQEAFRSQPPCGKLHRKSSGGCAASIPSLG
jgi:hypothetical protein